MLGTNSRNSRHDCFIVGLGMYAMPRSITLALSFPSTCTSTNWNTTQCNAWLTISTVALAYLYHPLNKYSRCVFKAKAQLAFILGEDKENPSSKSQI